MLPTRLDFFCSVALSLALILLATNNSDAFCLQSKPCSISAGDVDTHCGLSRRRNLVLLHESSNSDSDDSPILSSASPNSAMSETSRLSHAMLKVASVDDSVDFWVSKGGRVIRSKSNGKTNGEAKLLSAFVQMGPIGASKSKDSDKSDDEEDSESFALEIVKGPVDETRKNDSRHGLSYLGLSMLLQFRDRNPLLELMTGKSSGDDKSDDDASSAKENKSESKSESEDFPVKYVASAPGDGFAQLALLSDNKLVETCDFYTTVLGMDQKAQDQKLLCLRYDCEDPSKKMGVATTLVFENRVGSDYSTEASSKMQSGCFDHLAISTTSSIANLYQTILEENESTRKENPVKVYMKPTPMFGSHVLGLIDPNGYKVVLFGSD